MTYIKIGWTLGPIFTEWFNNQLHHALNAYCDTKTVKLKIFIVLDNAPGILL